MEDADAAMQLLNFAIFSEEVAAAEKRASGEEARDAAGEEVRASAPSARVEEGEAEAQKAAAPTGQGAPAVAKARNREISGDIGRYREM